MHRKVMTALFLLSSQTVFAATQVHSELTGKDEVLGVSMDCWTDDGVHRPKLSRFFMTRDQVGPIKIRSLQISTDELELYTGQRGHIEATCKVVAKILVKAGEQLKVSEVSLFGATHIPEQVCSPTGPCPLPPQFEPAEKCGSYDPRQGEEASCEGASFASIGYSFGGTSQPIIAQAVDSKSFNQLGSQQFRLNAKQDSSNYSQCHRRNQVYEISSTIKITATGEKVRILARKSSGEIFDSWLQKAKGRGCPQEGDRCRPASNAVGISMNVRPCR